MADHVPDLTSEPRPGPLPDPERVYVTTSWDDGHVLDHKLAQLLDRFALPGTFYVSPENVELARRDRLDAVGIRQLADRFEIGAHTAHHLRLPRLPDDQAREEISAGRRMLEDLTGLRVDTFCYVGGEYAERHVRMVADEGFRLARTVHRHSTTLGPALELPTTVHAYRHWSDLDVVRSLGSSVAEAARLFLSWDELAIHQFDRVLGYGGVFHLWGHSWEVEARGDWTRLERVLEHIAHRTEVCYVANGGLPLESRTGRAG